MTVRSAPIGSSATALTSSNTIVARLPASYGASPAFAGAERARTFLASSSSVSSRAAPRRSKKS